MIRQSMREITLGLPIHGKHNSCDPGKTFLWALMDELLQRRGGELGIDAACDYFKNHHYFRTREYVGVDHNLEALRRGARLHPSGRGILTRLEDFQPPQGCADVIVSTHTLQYLAPEARLQVADALANALTAQGLLLVQVPHDGHAPALVRRLQSHFQRVDVLYIGNGLSRLCTRLFTKKGIFGRTRLFNSRPVLALARLIARTEARTWQRPGRQTRVCICCTLKRRNSPSESLDLRRYHEIEPNIFQRTHAPTASENTL